MKRRKFFQTASISLAGLSLGTSCKNNTKSENSAEGGAQPERKIPDYRNNTKASFATANSKSANDRVNLALIGAGAHGTNVALQATELNANTRFKYVCDVDDTRGGRAITELKKMQGFEPIRVRDMRKVFDDKEIDGVIIATPEHWHALATIWACQAGKDVYVEKCISHDIFEGQKMIEAAMKYERIVQSGTQNRSAEYAYTARDYIKSGELGDLIAVHVRELLPGPVPFNEKEDTDAPDTIDWDMWLGPAPKVPYNISRNKSWGFYWDYSGGNAMSGGLTHQLDMARLVLDNPGFPKSVSCVGGRYFFNDNREVPDYQSAVFDYGNFVLNIEAGDCTPYMSKTSPEIRFGNDFPEWQQNATKIEILGTKRMMIVGRMGGGWQVFDKNGELVKQETGLYPLKPHIQNYIDCIRSRNQPNGDIVEGHKSSVLIHLANLSHRSGNKQLLFSPEYESIVNDNKAQELAYQSHRNGYEIPKVV